MWGVRPCSTAVVHPLGKGEVTSSILVMGSIYHEVVSTVPGDRRSEINLRSKRGWPARSLKETNPM